MLFNFQGPVCLTCYSQVASLLYHAVFRLSSGFFKFLKTFSLAQLSLTAWLSYHTVSCLSTGFLRFFRRGFRFRKLAYLISQIQTLFFVCLTNCPRQLVYNITPISFCQHLFSSFFDFLKRKSKNGGIPPFFDFLFRKSKKLEKRCWQKEMGVILYTSCLGQFVKQTKKRVWIWEIR